MFLLAPFEGSSSTVTRDMLGSHTHRRGNSTTPTAAVVQYMSSVAWTPGSPQRQPLGAIRAGCSLCHRQGQPAAPLASSPPGPHCICPFCGLAVLGTSQGQWHHPCEAAWAMTNVARSHLGALGSGPLAYVGRSLPLPQVGATQWHHSLAAP